MPFLHYAPFLDLHLLAQVSESYGFCGQGLMCDCALVLYAPGVN